MANDDADPRLYPGYLGIEAVLADASICQTERQVQYLIVKYNEDEFEVHNLEDVWKFVQTYVQEYNTKFEHQ